MKGKGFHLLKYRKVRENLSFQSAKRLKALTDAFPGCKNWIIGFVIYSYLKDSAFTAVERDAKL